MENLLQRKLKKFRIQELESRFQEFSDDLDALKELKAELSFRNSNRARQLALNVIHKIGSLEEYSEVPEMPKDARLKEGSIVSKVDQVLAMRLEQEIDSTNTEEMSCQENVDLSFQQNRDQSIVDLVNIGPASVRLRNTINHNKLPFETVGEYLDAQDMAIPTCIRLITNFSLESSKEMDDLIHNYAQASPQQKVDELEPNPLLLKKIDELKLSVRSANCLKNDNIVYIGDLILKTEAEMFRMPYFGSKSLNEIKEVLAGMGLHLGMDILDWPPDNIEGLAKKYEDPSDNDQEKLNVLNQFRDLSLREVLSNRTISVRLKNCIFNHEIIETAFLEFIGSLQNNYAKLFRIPNFGTVSFVELKTVCLDVIALKLIEAQVTSPDLERITSNICNENLGNVVYILGHNGENASKRNPPPPSKPSLAAYIDWLFGALDERSAEILKRRFGIDQKRHETLEEIGTDFGVTRERIRQIEAKAIKKMRIKSRSSPLIQYIENEAKIIWKTLSNDSSMLLDSHLDERKCFLSPHYFLAFEIAKFELNKILDKIAERYPMGWFWVHSGAVNLNDSAKKVEYIIASRPLPFAVKELENRCDIPNIEAACYLVLGIPIYNGYLVSQNPRIRLKRALALHSILYVKNVSLPLLNLLEEYHKNCPSDQCAARDVEIVMEALPHLFVQITADQWKSLGMGGELEVPAQQPDVQSEKPPQDDSESISDSLQRALLVKGPTQLKDLFNDAKKILPEGRSANSIGPILITRCDLFVRLLPGVYGIHSQIPTEDEILTGNLGYLLNDYQANFYARARWAGEAWGTFPVWTPAAEYRLCRWAKHSGSQEMLSSLLAVACVHEWPISIDEITTWEYLKNKHSLYQLSEPLNLNTPWQKPKMERVYAALVLAQENKSLNWVAANRVLGKRIDAHIGAGIVALLLQLGALETPSNKNTKNPWELAHPVTFYANELIVHIGEVLHRCDSLTWNSDLGISLIKRIRDNTEVKANWLDINKLLTSLEGEFENIELDHIDDPSGDIFKEHELTTNNEKQEARLKWLLEE